MPFPFSKWGGIYLVLPFFFKGGGNNMLECVTHFKEYHMFVWEVAKRKGITFEMVNQRFMVDYTTEDAERFWNSKWSDVQDTWLFYTPIYNLFWG